jgi:predicted Zn-dependent protease
MKKTLVMKKLVLMSLGMLLMLTGLVAQVPVSPLAEGVKMLNYEKNKSALAFFKEALDKTPGDGETSFWYGQAILAQNYNGIPTKEAIQKTKELYQQALQAKGNDPYLLIGMAHIQSLEGADANAVKQNIEVAITTTLNTKGKYKGKPNADIINALGRVYAELPMNVGDHRYAITKMVETKSAYEGNVSPAFYLNLGINYLKLGGEAGGEAVTAFNEAVTRDPKNAYAYYRIGKVYQTQDNKESFEENYKKALEADPTIAPVYLAYYTYYANRNTEIAKSNLDLFLKNADKDPVFDYLNADYLFQAGQYDASLEKAKQLETSVGISSYPRIAVLLAYNYDRKGDSTQAKNYIEQFVNNSPTDKILGADYELAIKVLSKFSGNQASLAALLEKAIAADSLKANKLKFYKLGYEMYEKSGLFADALKWYGNYSTLRGLKDEVYYYKTASLALKAKDGPTTAAISKEYIAAFPEKPNGYSYNVNAARLLDTANSLGILFEAVNTQNAFLLKDVEKNKQTLINNYYTLAGYYNETKAYDNAVLMCDKVLELVPNDPTTMSAKASFAKNAEIMKKMQAGKGAKPATEDPAAPKKN